MNNSKLRGELGPLLIFVAVDACALKPRSDSRRRIVDQG
jgi:hypothetical protein